MTRLPPAVLALALLFVGCRAHAVLDELPPPTAPLLERAVAYEQVKPSPFGAPGAVMTQWGAVPGQSLLLANGTLIMEPLELAPAVNPESKTMKHARQADELMETGGWLYAAGIGAGVLGIAGELAGGALLIATTPPGEQPSGPLATAGFTITIGSAIAGVVGLIGFMVPAAAVMVEAQGERATAFAAYEPDLRARLALVPKSSELAAKWQEPK